MGGHNELKAYVHFFHLKHETYLLCKDFGELSTFLNLLEYQAKGLLQEYDVTVQKFRVASNADEAVQIPQDFPCKEYVIKAQVLAGGRGKGHFDNGFKVSKPTWRLRVFILPKKKHF